MLSSNSLLAGALRIFPIFLRALLLFSESLGKRIQSPIIIFYCHFGENAFFFSVCFQCPWLPDICLVQCARGNRPNSTNCIIFEINKFLIGLEVVQERQLHKEASVLRLEDDTNCSLSSIEEDFLTASEHMEEDIEAEEYRSGETLLIKQACSPTHILVRGSPEKFQAMSILLLPHTLCLVRVDETNNMKRTLANMLTNVFKAA